MVVKDSGKANWLAMNQGRNFHHKQSSTLSVLFSVFFILIKGWEQISERNLIYLRKFKGQKCIRQSTFLY